MDIVDRMFALVDDQYKEQKDFAEAIGVHPTRVSEWRKRKSQSYQKRLPQIASVLGTTTEYLLTGEGPKYKPQTEAQFFRCKIIELCNEAGKDPCDAMTEANVITGPIRRNALFAQEFQWRCPKVTKHNVDALSNYFNVPAEIFFMDGKVPDWNSGTPVLSSESLNVATAYEKADEKSRAIVRLTLGIDEKEH